MVVASNLTKVFRVHRRKEGFGAALRSIVKRDYETVVAVDSITFEIQRGERVGFLGPNGAGKTTTLKMLSGLLHPTSGELKVAGHVPKKRSPAFLSEITLVMGQKQQLIWDLPPVDTYALNRAIFGVTDRDYAKTYEELSDLLDLPALATKPTRRLSLGERMKCELAAALLHRPTTLFLDEPTIGLDVSTQAAIREFIKSYNERHEATVLLTSHYMEDVTQLCNRVIVIDKGRIIYDGNLRELARRESPDKRVTFTLREAVSPDVLERLGRVESTDASSVTLRVGQDRLHEVVSHALASLPVIDLAVADPPLEEILRQIFHRERERA